MTMKGKVILSEVLSWEIITAQKEKMTQTLFIIISFYIG